LSEVDQSPVLNGGLDLGLRVKELVAGRCTYAGDKSHTVHERDEWRGIELFDVDHLSDIPGAIGNENGGRHRRNPCRIGDGLAAYFFVTLFVVADVVDHHLVRLAVFGALDQIADAGLARVSGGQRGRVGQYGLDDFERHDFLTTGGRDRLFGQKTQVLQDGEDIDVVVAKTHPEADVGHLQYGR